MTGRDIERPWELIHVQHFRELEPAAAARALQAACRELGMSIDFTTRRAEIGALRRDVILVIFSRAFPDESGSS